MLFRSVTVEVADDLRPLRAREPRQRTDELPLRIGRRTRRAVTAEDVVAVDEPGHGYRAIFTTVGFDPSRRLAGIEAIALSASCFVAKRPHITR